MPQYFSPGVYVEEVDAGPKPIEGVSTSVAGAVGVTAFGPTSGKPQLVTSFAEFNRIFGGFLPDPNPAVYNNWALDPVEGARWWHFPLAVKGFFDNGGQQLYVKRVFSTQAVAASGNLGQGMVSVLKSDAKANATTLKLDHLISIAEGTVLKLFRGDNGNQVPGNFRVTSYDSAAGEVSVDTALPIALVAKRRDFIEIYARSATPVPAANVTLSFSARALGEWGNDLSVLVKPMVGATLNILFDPTIANNNSAATTVVATANNAGPPPSTTVTVASAGNLANNDHILVQGVEYVISNVNAGANTFDITPSLPGAGWAAGTAVKRLRAANTPNTGKTMNVWGASTSLYTGAFVELDNGHKKETFTVASTAGNVVTLSNKPQNSYFEGQKMRVIEAEVDVQYAPAGGEVASETFQNLRLVGDGTIEYIATRINQDSAFVTVTAGPGLSPTAISSFPIAPNGLWQALAHGDDQLARLTVDDFVGKDGGSGKRTGIQALEDITDISICLVPGVWSATVQSALIAHCETLRYRFAILDPQDGLTIEGIRAFRESLDTKYAALYYPWIEVRDPSVSRNVQIAPSGHIAGIYARVDTERGVHKAPANEEILSISKVAQDVTKREQDLLNPRGIDALRYFPGRGNRVWGARTVSSDSSWKYINVRRLFIFVEASIDYGTQWVVFEPNDEPLWARVRQTITNFLTTVWRGGALQGAKPDEAFFVKCDHTTMTQDDIDNGRLICVIGIAPVKPAEFVIFRIQQKTLET